MIRGAMPPAMFDVDERGDLTPPAFEPGEHAPKLTPRGAHLGLGPGIWADFPILCGEPLYGSVESSGQRIWVWHVCSCVDEHEQHSCDRCEVTW